MLIGIAVITDVMVIVIGVGKKQIVFGKNIRAANIDGGQM
jgi:hypothetical protein